MISVFTWQVCTSGSDQMAIQRFLATRDVRAARRSLITSLSTDVLVMALLAAVGLALIAWFTAHQSLLGGHASLVDEADRLFPRFVVVGLPAGVSGLVIAAILSAAMSSLSSGVNSACAVITEDFIGRLGKTGHSGTESVGLVRVLSVIVGLVAVTLSILVGTIEGNLVELCFKVVNLLTAPLFVLFFMALFVRWATPSGTLVGLMASVAVAVGIAYFNLFGFSFLWMMPASLLTGIAVAALVSSIGSGWSEPRAVES
jgi:SSS family solute:Na+ symporter